MSGPQPPDTRRRLTDWGCGLAFVGDAGRDHNHIADMQIETVPLSPPRALWLSRRRCRAGWTVLTCVPFWAAAARPSRLLSLEQERAGSRSCDAGRRLRHRLPEFGVVAEGICGAPAPVPAGNSAKQRSASRRCMLLLQAGGAKRRPAGANITAASHAGRFP